MRCVSEYGRFKYFLNSMCRDGLRCGDGLRVGESSSSPLEEKTAVLSLLPLLNVAWGLVGECGKVPYAGLPLLFQSGLDVGPDM